MGKRKTGERKKELLDKEAGHTAAHFPVMRACGDGVIGVDPIGCCDPNEKRDMPLAWYWYYNTQKENNTFVYIMYSAMTIYDKSSTSRGIELLLAFTDLGLAA